MGGRHCCVVNCRRRSHDHRGRRIPNGLTFHCFPAWRRHEGEQISRLTRSRRAAWVAAVDRPDITFSRVPKSTRVCSRHFRSGKPAYEMLESDPDWVPSLHLSPSDGNIRRTERLLQPVQKDRHQKQKDRHQNQKDRHQNQKDQKDRHQNQKDRHQNQKDRHQNQKDQKDRHQNQKDRHQNQKDRDQNQKDRDQRCSTETSPPQETEPETTPGPARPAVRPWREVRSLLHEVLQRKTDFSQQPAKKVDLDFRDFFRDTLEASLETSSRSRAPSDRPPSTSREDPVDLNQTSSSSCVNCVTLQRRNKQLEEVLSRLTGGQEDLEVFSKALLRPDQDLQSPETVHVQEHWVDQDEADQDQDVDPADPRTRKDQRSKGKPRQPPRFQEAWLKQFWFLRYSPTLNQMWCHACRLHSDKSHHNTGLIKGSRLFRFRSIKQHSDSNYHKDCVARHLQL